MYCQLTIVRQLWCFPLMLNHGCLVGGTIPNIKFFFVLFCLAVIDLSDLDPDDLLASSEHLEEIPQCSFAPARKSKTSSQDVKSEDSVDGSTSKSMDESCDQSHDTSSLMQSNEFSPPPLTGDKSHDRSRDQQQKDVVDHMESPQPADRKLPGPPPLIKLSPLSR